MNASGVEKPSAAPASAGTPAPHAAPIPRWSLRTALLLVLGLAVWAALYAVIQPLSDLLSLRLLALAPASHLGQSAAFFLYEAPKVQLRLVLVVFGVGIVRSFFTPERTRAILAGKRESVGNALAALLGVVTPFCSCSAVPLFIGFVEVGIPLGVTLSFLISAPMVNEVALVLLGTVRPAGKVLSPEAVKELLRA